MIDLRKNKCETKNYELWNKTDYLELELKGEQTYKSAILLIKNEKDFENAAVLLFRSIQLYSNSLLVKKTGFKSKGKIVNLKNFMKEK